MHLDLRRDLTVSEIHTEKRVHVLRYFVIKLLDVKLSLWFKFEFKSKNVLFYEFVITHINTMTQHISLSRDAAEKVGIVCDMNKHAA